MVVAMELLISGVAAGITYGLVALSLVVTYKTSRVFNVALPEVSTASAYGVFQLMAFGIPYGWAFVLVVIMAATISFVLERIVARISGDGSVPRMFVILFGVFFMIYGATFTIWGGEIRNLASPFVSVYRVAKVAIPEKVVAVVVVAAISVLLLHMVFEYTRFGLALRATAINRVESMTQGIPVKLMLPAGWALSGAIAAIAGILIAPIFLLSPDMMITPLIYIFAAWIAGGLDSSSGALIAGIFIGVGENFLGYYVHFIGDNLKLVVVLALIVVLLVFRPQGLLGSKEVVRV